MQIPSLRGVYYRTSSHAVLCQLFDLVQKIGNKEGFLKCVSQLAERFACSFVGG